MIYEVSSLSRRLNTSEKLKVTRVVGPTSIKKTSDQKVGLKKETNHRRDPQNFGQCLADATLKLKNNDQSGPTYKFIPKTPKK